MINYPPNIADFVPGSENTKPHMGRIEQWVKTTYDDWALVWGVFVDRPGWPPNSYAHTSYIVSQEGNEIETRNSRYTLGEPASDEERS